MKRILIQNQRSHLFLNDRGDWTRDEKRAQDFPTTLNAVVHCVQQELAEVQLFVRVQPANGSSSREFIISLEDGHLRAAQDFGREKSECGSARRE